MGRKPLGPGAGLMIPRPIHFRESIMNRRKLIFGLFAAPAIIQITNLMAIKAFQETGTWESELHFHPYDIPIENCLGIKPIDAVRSITGVWVPKNEKSVWDAGLIRGWQKI